jgi:hypothetical protein
LEVENPNPGKRPGQVHVQNDATGEKWYFNYNDRYFYNPKTGKRAPSYINNLLNDMKFLMKLTDAAKYLGM